MEPFRAFSAVYAQPSPVKAEPNCSGLDEDGLHITAWLVPVGGTVCVGLGGVVFWEYICHVCGL